MTVPLTGPEIIARVRLAITACCMPRQVAELAVLETLDAIREPSEAMIHACGDDVATCGSYTCATLNWRAMIDALRKEIA